MHSLPCVDWRTFVPGRRNTAHVPKHRLTIPIPTPKSYLTLDASFKHVNAVVCCSHIASAELASRKPFSAQSARRRKYSSRASSALPKNS